MFRSALSVAALCVAAAVALLPATPAANQAGTGRERTLYASVLDDKDEPVTDIRPDEFVVREGNARREVLRVSRASDPLVVALMVDNSAAAESDIRNFRDGLQAFLAKMREHDTAIIALADRPTILQDYTRSEELQKKAIGRLFSQPGSGMQFLEAVVDVGRGLARRDEPRAAMVAVLTDGAEFGNQHYNQVLDALRRSGAAMYVFPIGTFRAPVDDERRNRSVVLDEGPRQTGGVRRELLSSMGLEQALERLARELDNQYKVVYGRPESLIDPGPVTVSVTRPGLTARGTPERRKPGA
jgi:VWFA-related protein